MALDRLPGLAFLHAVEHDTIALSRPVLAEITGVLNRPKLARFIVPATRDRMLTLLLTHAVWFDPTLAVTDCRDAKDNKYLELVLASNGEILVSSDADLLALNPWRGLRIMRPADYLALRAPR